MKRLLFALFTLSALLHFQPTWAQYQKGSDIDGEINADGAGYSVSMPDQNTVAIGAPYNDGTGNMAGQVRVHTWNGTTWTQKGQDLDGEAADDQSGYSVSMPDANTVAIGAPFNNGNGIDAGHVRVYQWNGSVWVQKGLDLNGEAADDRAGYAVSMPDANTVAIGAILNDGWGTNSGHVRIYRWNGTAWVQKGIDIDGSGSGNQSGYSVSMPDSNTVAIGAPFNTSLGSGVGQVRVFGWNGSSWVQKGFAMFGENTFDYFGHSVTMPDANTVAGGSPYNDGNGSNSGHARVYQWTGSSWQQKGVDINGEAAEDGSGWSISMPDANTIGIGARWNDGSGTDAGHARVYRWNGSTWTIKGTDMNGNSASDLFGQAVSMPDTNTMAVGSLAGAGYVKIFNNFSIALPVSLTLFTGQPKAQANVLQWTTASEENNAFFLLQHSTDGVHFATLTRINSLAPEGNSQTDLHYSFEHAQPGAGHHYYRLEQEDIDQRAMKFSQVVHLYRGHTGSTLAVYPNPAEDVVHIDHYSTRSNAVTIKMLDMSGRLVNLLQVQGQAGNNILTIPLGGMVRGLYTLQVFENGQLSYVSRLQKD